MVVKVEEIRKNILDPRKLPLPPKPIVTDIKVFPYVDHHGIDSLEVWVILDDSTTRKDRSVDNVRAIRTAIHDTLLGAEIELFPYIRVLTPSDMKEAGIEL
jgi:hypothetical protein